MVTVSFRQKQDDEWVEFCRIHVDGSNVESEGDDSWLDYSYEPYSEALKRAVSFDKEPEVWAQTLPSAYEGSNVSAVLESVMDKPTLSEPEHIEPENVEPELAVAMIEETPELVKEEEIRTQEDFDHEDHDDIDHEEISLVSVSVRDIEAPVLDELEISAKDYQTETLVETEDYDLLPHQWPGWQSALMALAFVAVISRLVSVAVMTVFNAFAADALFGNGNTLISKGDKLASAFIAFAIALAAFRLLVKPSMGEIAKTGLTNQQATGITWKTFGLVAFFTLLIPSQGFWALLLLTLITIGLAAVWTKRELRDRSTEDIDYIV